MRWGAASLSAASLRWVRPLTGIVCLLDDDVVPFAIDGVASGRTTAGHRFLSHGPVVVATAHSYAAQLRDAHVILSAAERGMVIEREAQARAAEAGLTLIADAGLVAENAGLTEWPVPLLGRFDPAFLRLPPEVIQLTMRTNQKYFACTTTLPRIGEGEHGAAMVEGLATLAPAFVCVANLIAPDHGQAIIAGNGKVLAARLSDARFFWDQDRAKPLAEHARGLDRLVFHEKLGTVADKVERVARLARWLVESGALDQLITTVIPAQAGTQNAASTNTAPERDAPLDPCIRGNDEGVDERRAHTADLAEQAARLMKADLTTLMVGEFPELQGIIGGHYATAEGLDPRVAAAIRDQYRPAGQGDAVPTAPVSVAVGLADRLDTLFGFFAIDEQPTGSRDPFALRRAALTALSTLTSTNLRLSIEELYRTWVSTSPFDWGTVAVALEHVRQFLADRLKVQQREAGVRHDLIDAVFALGTEDDLVRLLARVRALQAFIGTGDGQNLLAGYKRAANILRIEEKKDGTVYDAAPDPALLTSPPEQALAAALDRATARASAAVAAEDFTAAMAALATLRAPVDDLFASVTINDPDPATRANRLNLLAGFRNAVHAVADFSRVESSIP